MTYPPQPGQGMPGGPPPGPPPGYYPPPGWNPQPPPKQSGGLKWLLIGVAVLLVIAISVGITVVVTRGGSGPGGTTTTAAPPSAGDVASANDTAPVSIITSEPTCAPWRPIQNALAAAETNGWGQRDPSSESSSWTPQVRSQYEAVAAGMRSAADQEVLLAKQTPHRVMRELYEQSIAYGRAYADSLSSYQPKDDLLSRVHVNLHDTISGVCDAIDRGAAASRTPVASTTDPRNAPPTTGSVSDPDRFVAGPSSTCTAWVKAHAAFDDDLVDWNQLDHNVPAAAWTPEQRSVAERAARTFESNAAKIGDLARQEPGVFDDLATLSSLYLRAFAATIPSYTLRDSWLAPPGLRLNEAIWDACKAVAG